MHKATSHLFDFIFLAVSHLLPSYTEEKYHLHHSIGKFQPSQGAADNVFPLTEKVVQTETDGDMPYEDIPF